MAAFVTSLSQRIHEVLERRHAHALLADDCVEFTGGDILEKSARLAALIREMSRPGARVGVLFPNSAAKALALFAIWMSGRVPVLLTNDSADESSFRMWEFYQLDGLVVSDESYPRLECGLPTLRLNSFAEVGDFASGRILHRRLPPLPPARTAVILYTSGSSGEPKGVCLSGESLLYTADVLIAQQQLSSETVAGVLLPISHTMALNTQFLPVFFAGGKSIFFEPSFGLGRLFRSISESHATCIALVAELVRIGFDERAKRGLPAAESVRQVTLAGGLIRSQHLQMARELFPNAIIYKGYGLTEGIRVSMISSEDPRFFADGAGDLLPGQHLEVRDDRGQPLPPNEMGHLFVAGPNVMLGYDQASASPVIDERGFLDTKDMGFLDRSGQLVIVGRSDGVVKIRGKRVALKEIEDAVSTLFPVFVSAKCLAFANAQGENRLALFFERVPAPSVDEFCSRLENGLRKKLRDHHSLPKDVFLLESFPRTANGKVKLSELRNLWEQRESLRTWGAVPADRFRMRFFTQPPGTSLATSILGPRAESPADA
ncbi:MAG: acyl--CoA ligase [Bdellovibrionales bacterium]|nr:acyl--CoA ligase [Bdellovibrionales bacterium]